MANSVVNICNVALSLVGETQINNATLGSATETERQCSLLYPVLRDRLIREHPWNFAERRQQLALLAETPDFEFNYYYQLPSDCLRVRSLYQTEQSFRVEGRKIATNAAPCNLIYTARVEDPAQFDETFSYTLSCMLAADLAMVLSTNRSLQQQLSNKAEEQLRKAKQYDAQEGTPRRFTMRNSWDTLRRHWRGTHRGSWRGY